MIAHPAPTSPLTLSDASVSALMSAAQRGVLPCEGDSCWAEPPWAVLPRTGLARLAASAPFSRKPSSTRVRLAAVLAVAAFELARRAARVLWVIREWLRALPLPFGERESIERLVHAALVSSAPAPGSWVARLAGCIRREDLLPVLDAVSVPARVIEEWPFVEIPRGFGGSDSPSHRDASARGGMGCGSRAGARARLWLLVGIPASGKSTWAAAQSAGRVVCMDVIREALTGDAGDQRRNDEVFRRAMGEVRRGLLEEEQVIFDATNATPEARQQPLRIAASVGAAVTAVFFDTPFWLCAQRNAVRPRRVPVDAMLRFAQNLVPPLPFEFDARVVVGVN